jgi:RNA polymerase sigma factor (sigma-70 family)
VLPLSLSDADLVARCREGDHDAWRAFVEPFARYVFAIATQGYRLSHHDAEEVFQEVFARAYEHLGRLRDDRAIRPWIGQLTRRLCVDRLRAAARERDLEEWSGPPGSDETMARLDDALTVQDALSTLSQDCREVLDRFFCRDESYRTIGVALGIPAGTIASRISRCLARLRERLTGKSRPRPSVGMRAGLDPTGR